MGNPTAVRSVLDAETGLVYLRARYYDPGPGQFLTRDPLEAITDQPYADTDNDPINRVDSTGMDWWDPRDWDQTVIGFLEEVARSEEVQSAKPGLDLAGTVSGFAPRESELERSHPVLSPASRPPFYLGSAATVLDIASAYIDCFDGGGLDRNCAVALAGVAVPGFSGWSLKFALDPKTAQQLTYHE